MSNLIKIVISANTLRRDGNFGNLNQYGAPPITTQRTKQINYFDLM